MSYAKSKHECHPTAPIKFYCHVGGASVGIFPYGGTSTPSEHRDNSLFAHVGLGGYIGSPYYPGGSYTGGDDGFSFGVGTGNSYLSASGSYALNSPSMYTASALRTAPLACNAPPCSTAKVSCEEGAAEDL